MSEAAKDKPSRILVIEDNPADSELLKMALDEAGLEYELTVIEDGADALAFFRQDGAYQDSGIPDLALVDLNLPKHDGLEILGAVRANPAFSEMPVAVLSSSSSPRDRSKLQTFAGIRYITKPTDLEQYSALGRLVRSMLG